jgi:hypothetical protein
MTEQHAKPPTKEQLDTLEWVVRDLRSEAGFIAPVGLADPVEISRRDRFQAEALTDYADKLEGRIKKARYEAQQRGASA